MAEATIARGVGGARGPAGRGGLRRGQQTRRTAAGSAGDVAAPTAADNAALRREARARDEIYQGAYDAGRQGLAYDPVFGDDPSARAAYQSGLDERSRGRREQAADVGRTIVNVRGPDVVSDGAGFLLGLILYALALNYIQGGARQAKGWIAAKFVNRPYTPRGAK